MPIHDTTISQSPMQVNANCCKLLQTFKNPKKFYFFFRLNFSCIFFRATAKPNCKGIAGVKGPAQNAIYEPNTVHHHGDITHAKTAETIQGDQNISSAIITHNSISRFITCFRSHCHAFLIRSFILLKILLIQAFESLDDIR